jgi:hypothetical protein
VLALEPGIDLLLGFVFGDAVMLLDAARQFGALTRDHVEIVISELSPLLLNLAFRLLPVAFDGIPIDLAPKFYPVPSSLRRLDLPCWAAGALGAEQTRDLQ